jgi:hypothetical protein
METAALVVVVVVVSAMVLAPDTKYVLPFLPY